MFGVWVGWAWAVPLPKQYTNMLRSQSFRRRLQRDPVADRLADHQQAITQTQTQAPPPPPPHTQPAASKTDTTHSQRFGLWAYCNLGSVIPLHQRAPWHGVSHTRTRTTPTHEIVSQKYAHWGPLCFGHARGGSCQGNAPHRDPRVEVVGFAHPRRSQSSPTFHETCRMRSGCHTTPCTGYLVVKGLTCRHCQ